MKLTYILPVVLASVVFAGCTRNNTVDPSAAEVINVSPSSVAAEIDQRVDQAQETAQDAVASLPKLIVLTEQGDSGQTGTATLTEENGQVKVVLDMEGGNYTAPQPAHIHIGHCPTPGEVKYPLTNVVNGDSETLLSIDMETLMNSNDTLAINVHKSAAEVSVYTACGNLK